MIYEKIGKENIKYIDEDDIMKYVDNIMNGYLPKTKHNPNNSIIRIMV